MIVDPHASTAETQPTFVRLLNILNAIRDMSPAKALSADEEKLLDWLIIAWHGKDRLCVSDVMNCEGKSSRSSAYRQLMGLHTKGWVRFRSDAEDKRVKYVEPTLQTQHYMTDLSTSVDGLLFANQPA